MSQILRKELRITLMSDYACGSGESWGNTVDSDIVHDDCGFPYIPARRIRGLMREAAWELSQFDKKYEVVEKQLFDHDHYFALYNAQIEAVDKMRKECKENGISAETVLDYYTSIRHQNSLENGVSKENFLRSIRVVNKGITFIAKMEYEKEDEDVIKNIISLVGHSGLSRTRGLGEIKLEITEDNSLNRLKIMCKTKKDVKEIQLEKLADATTYSLTLGFTNKSPLIVSSTSVNKTLDYITGSSILGHFANQYLQTNKDDAEFYRMFLDGDVKFTNAYITDEKFNLYYPIRETLYSEKVVSDIAEGKKYFDKINGECPYLQDLRKNNNSVVLKKNHDQYIFENHGSPKLLEVDKELAYHHRRPDDKTIGHAVDNTLEGMGMFYQKEVISANQYFVGRIIGKGKDLKAILQNQGTNLKLGNSKNTQYGYVEIQKAVVEKYETKNVNGSDKTYICTLRSPLLLFNEKRQSDLSVEALKKACHFKTDAKCYVGYTELGGYNSKWKLQKPSYSAFSAGTCIIGKLEASTISEDFVGELISEGNGQIYIEEIPKYINNYFLLGTNNKQDSKTKNNNTNSNKNKNNKKPKNNNNQPKNKSVTPSKGGMTALYLSQMKKQIELDAMKQVLLLSEVSFKTDGFNSSVIGRLLKMLQENNFEKEVENISDTNNKKDNAKTRIKEIKSICNKCMAESGLSDKDIESYKDELYLRMYKEFFSNIKVLNRKHIDVEE